MTETQLNSQSSSSKLLVVMGVLWLLLAAGLLYYQLVNPAKVEINWETATEQETAGFYLYRSNSPDGEFVILNPDGIVNAEGSPVSGASYTYVDEEVVPGETYYYLLEEVEFDASRNRYEQDIFEYEVPRFTWWAVVLTAASALIGLVLLVTGLKEARNL